MSSFARDNVIDITFHRSRERNPGDFPGAGEEKHKMHDPAVPSSGAQQHDVPVLRRAEQLLRELTGVSSARIVGDTPDRIKEIHILTDSRVEPKQVVRNVESALLAQLGIKIDHRKVSVAQVRSPEDATAARIVGFGSGERRYLFAGYEFERKMAHRVECRVKLQKEDEEYMGSAEGADIEKGRMMVAAQAALSALELAENDEVSFALDGVKMIDSFAVPVVVAGVYGLSGRSRTYLAGAAPATDSPEHAAILAALKATNRWLTTR